MKNLAMAYSMKKRAKKMAKGGEVKGVHMPEYKSEAGMSGAGESVRSARRSSFAKEAYHDEAKTEHKRVLSEMRSMKKPNLMAEGGFVEEEEASGYAPHPEEHEKLNHAAIAEDADMIARIMHQRYSMGGRVANDVGVAEADESPAEYDDLVLRDDLEGEQPEDSNEHGDSAVHDDLIDRIMLKKKKDRMPRPA